MFESIGWSEILVVLVAAVVLFGPDKLPSLVRDLAKYVKLFRRWTAEARRTLDDELPPEMRNMDLADLHPKNFIRKALLDDEPPFSLDDDDEPATKRRALTPGKPAPYDVDAT